MNICKTCYYHDTCKRFVELSGSKITKGACDILRKELENEKMEAGKKVTSITIVKIVDN